MSMLLLNGTVLNVFDTPASTDKETGEIRPAKHRVQVMCENTLQNGQVRMDLLNLSVEDIELYKKAISKPVRIPVGAFVSGSAVQFYALKGQKPQFAP